MPMRTTQGRRFALLVSLPPDRSSQAVSPAERALRLIDSIEAAGSGPMPIAWHLPAADASAGDGASPARFRDALRRRLEQAGDTVLPMGLTGAAHAALRVDEIQADVAWAVTNIWATGVADTFRLDPPLVVPAVPDTLRRDALAAYGAAPVPVGLLGESHDGAWIAVVPNGGAIPGRALPVFEADSLPADEISARTLARALTRRRREVRSVAGPDAPVVVRAVVGGHDDDRQTLALAAACVELAGRHGWTLVGVGAEDAPSANVTDLFAPPRPAIHPDSGGHASALRRRRGSKINTRRILEAVAHGEPEAPPAAAPSPDGQREFVASMLGQATIPGAAVEARFDAGRLCGLHGRSDSRRRDRPAHSELIVGGRRTQETVTSCFSFETPVSRGLRSEAMLEDDETGTVVRVRTEYAFVGEHDALVAGQHVLGDGGSGDGLLYVLAAPVLEPGRSAVTGRFADGTTYDVDLAFDREELVLWAEAFGIWDGESRSTLVALGPDNRPVTWSLTALRHPEPRIVLGGRYEPRGRLDQYASLLLLRGEIDDELVTRAMAGRLPADIATELAAARASEAAMREALTPERQEA